MKDTEGFRTLEIKIMWGEKEKEKETDIKTDITGKLETKDTARRGRE